MANNTLIKASISPAEMRFWDDCAQKASGMVRRMDAQVAAQVPEIKNPYKVGGLALGAVLGAATLTKFVPGKWKWVSGAGAVASTGVAVLSDKKLKKAVVVANSTLPVLKESLMNYAKKLDSDPDLRRQLANYLSVEVTAEDIKATGIDNVVANKIIQFGRDTLYLDTTAIKREAVARQMGGNTCHTCPAGRF